MQLTLPELTAARGFLGQARMLVAGVHSLFFNIGEASTAARRDESMAALPMRCRLSIG